MQGKSYTTSVSSKQANKQAPRPAQASAQTTPPPFHPLPPIAHRLAPIPEMPCSQSPRRAAVRCAVLRCAALYCAVAALAHRPSHEAHDGIGRTGCTAGNRGVWSRRSDTSSLVQRKRNALRASRERQEASGITGGWVVSVRE